MARRGVSGSAVQAKPRKRRLTLGRAALWAAFTIVVLALLFYGIGGWHFSNRIRNDVLTVTHEDPEYDLETIALDGSQVTLRGDDDHLDDPGIFGLEWNGGYAQVGDVLETEEPEGDVLTVTRRYLPGTTELHTGTDVRLDSYAYGGDPTTAFNYPFTEVTYESPLGDMGAWYVRGSTDTWMIIVHGKGGDRAEGLRLLPLAWDRGYHVLLIDYRNDEDEPPDPSGWYQYGLTEWEDVNGAARYAREQGAENLVMVGYSMGGGAVVNFVARSPLRNQVSATILDAPLLDLEETVDYNAADTSLGIGPWNVPSSLTWVAKTISGWRYDLDWDEFDYIETLWRDLHAPMLIFHGTADTTVPLATSIAMERKRPDITTLITEEGVDHVLSWNADPDAYEAAVNDFLDQQAAP